MEWWGSWDQEVKMCSGTSREVRWQEYKDDPVALRLEQWCVDSSPCLTTCGGHTLDENLDTAHSYHLTILCVKGNRVCPWLNYDHFSWWSITHSIIGAISEIHVIPSVASKLTSVIHSSLKDFGLLNIQEGVWQSEGREISRDKKDLGKSTKTVLRM